jgi:hypothetical protein
MAKTTKAQAAAMATAISANVKAVIDEANKLSVQRETFEKEELARSNKALYAILSKVYALFNKAVKDGCIKETAKEMRSLLKERGVKVQSNTPSLTCFVRFVFNSDRKRAYNYASTLMAAVDAEIKPENLAAFIEGSNGVEECKKKYKMKDETKQRVEAVAAASVDVMDILKTMPSVANITLPNATVDLSDGVDFAFIVARSVGNGSFELLRAVPKSTKAIQTAAVKELAKNLIEVSAKAQTYAKEQKVKTTTEVAVKSISAKAAAKMTLKELEAA